MPFGYILSFMVLAMLALILLLGWLGALAVLIKGHHKYSHGQKWRASIPLALVSAVGLWLVYLCLAPPNPAIAYKDAFGVVPSSDITAQQRRWFRRLERRLFEI